MYIGESPLRVVATISKNLGVYLESYKYLEKQNLKVFESTGRDRLP